VTAYFYTVELEELSEKKQFIKNEYIHIYLYIY